jgi:hypothetical protein
LETWPPLCQAPGPRSFQEETSAVNLAKIVYVDPRIAYHVAMDEPPKKDRWYHYQLPLPAWFPDWLAACMVVRTTTFLAFWYGLNELN